MPSSTSRSKSSISATTSVMESSGAVSNYTREVVGAYVFNDVCAYEVSSVDKFLEAFLEACCRDVGSESLATNSASPPDQTLKQPTVDSKEPYSSTPSCSADEPKDKQQGIPASDSDKTIRAFIKDQTLLGSCLKLVMELTDDIEIRLLLNKFCDLRGKGADRYAPFAALANCALDKLNQLDHGQVPGLRGPSDIKILFHVHDTRSLQPPPSSSEFADRKPDLIITSLAATNRAHNKADQSYTDALRGCNPCKSERFKFLEALALVEIKWQYASVSSQPPPKYDTGLAREICALDLKTLSNPPGSSHASESSSIHSNDISGDTSTRNSSSNSNTAPQTPISQGLKRAADSGSPSQKSKKPKTRRSTKSNPPILHSERSLFPWQTFLPQFFYDVVWIWWIDRQGAIQSTGLNFVLDLPRFLVLLLALQRFTLSDWGYNLTFDPGAQKIHTSAGPPAQTSPVELEISGDRKVSIDPNDVVYLSKTLVSRATTVLRAVGTFPEAPGCKLVAKISWPNKDRENEFHIIGRALGCGEDLANYLPRAFGYRDSSEDTGVIRLKLGLGTQTSRPARVLRVIILEELAPIIELEGEQFFCAWVQCTRVHYVCWKKGVYHQDISLNNLMYRSIEGKIYGTLSDWDLSHTDQSNSTGNDDLAATIPFLSLDILYRRARNLPFRRTYCSDLESFVWVLLWVVLFVQGRKVVQDHPTFREVAVDEFGRCYRAKLDLLQDLSRALKPLEPWKEFKPLTLWSRPWIQKQFDEAWGQNVTTEVPDPTFNSFLASVETEKPASYIMPAGPNVL
ncbi:hypothetical protein RhiJN_11104 [Ceratobasidium sp. AG-Ba]|nr:hypothetical protein RhiJN_11104 [Ceratobasidium sp. AG-Ba]QRW11812.1 hypothetical protein RhiLY_10811 [Ceratobasidium sp. AG-Ba]